MIINLNSFPFKFNVKFISFSGPVTGVNIHVITPLVCCICVFYTCVGGLKAVVWTDVVQTFSMFGALILVAVKGTLDLGGADIVINNAWETNRIEAPMHVNP